MTLIGGGAVGAQDLYDALALAPICVAADSGADVAVQAGIDLAAVIGDMDSIAPATRAQIPDSKFHKIPEQMSTDFDKALRNIAAPCIIGVGFSGKRVDHQLGVLHTLVMRPEAACIILGADDIIFLCPRMFTLPLEPGTRVSLFPLGAVMGRSQGLEWPIEGLEFAPWGASGTSNRATGDLHLEMDDPFMLCILPRRFLGAVTERLAGMPAPARWPARAEQYKDPPQS
ncbi:thiamine diphosphokinase [Roseobacter fucihabitans]|uniref:thiamine diphosphokinase n=1 Tax=Roseobacter fucihabitans TaxID=1537242 RepID=UPI00292A3FC1|nr:thiamine diphosphokinase [Roseobacter litoralis]